MFDILRRQMKYKQTCFYLPLYMGTGKVGYLYCVLLSTTNNIIV